ncbi:hypothetical protein PVAND_000272 [Polypedilum vanderplanki]|uniref:Uncharacterized protein n=1 Tax=Polypedilum vanderplanki TaxID=319348 RepID=A0A9J6BJU6_POLVA|nr:hypothetical protein PVAND_000272 [Polypedilum vanderplanki]
MNSNLERQNENWNMMFKTFKNLIDASNELDHSVGQKYKQTNKSPTDATSSTHRNNNRENIVPSTSTAPKRDIRLDDTIPIPTKSSRQSDDLNSLKAKFDELQDEFSRLLLKKPDRKPLYSRGNFENQFVPTQKTTKTDNELLTSKSVPLFVSNQIINGSNIHHIQSFDQNEPIFIPQSSSSKIPLGIQPIWTLNHGSIVSAVAFSNPMKYVFTGGKGCVKIWDISKPLRKPVGQLSCFKPNSDIRTIKLLKDSNTLIVGGDSENLTIWDATGPKPRIKGLLPSFTSACYDFAVSDESRIGYSCLSDGTIAVYDLKSNILARRFEGHNDGVTSIGVNSDGTKFWTGSLDCTARSWDLRMTKQINQFDFQSHIYSLDFNSKNDWLAIGFKNSNIQAVDVKNNEKYLLNLHQNSVLGLKFAKNEKWFISNGSDGLLTMSKFPCGPNIHQTKQNSAMLSCDISADDKFIVTGSADKNATVYQVLY